MKQKKNASSAGAGRRIINEMRLRLPASSVNEGVARGTVGAFLAQLDPTVEELADLKCVVSEAVTNCVVHAYGGRGGAIYITIRARADREVELSVRDCGCGIADVAEAMRPMFTTDKSGERSAPLLSAVYHNSAFCESPDIIFRVIRFAFFGKCTRN